MRGSLSPPGHSVGYRLATLKVKKCPLHRSESLLHRTIVRGSVVHTPPWGNWNLPRPQRSPQKIARQIC